ncbi:DMT family transporter [archaeon]|nr:MAG: DMT family transporter [archaeon]
MVNQVPLPTPAVAKRTLFLCTSVYGFSYICQKWLQKFIQPELSLIFRFSLGSALFLPKLLRFRGDFAVILAGLEMGFWCATGFAVQATGLKYTSASKAALLSSLGVILPPIFTSIEHAVSNRSAKKDNKVDFVNKQASLSSMTTLWRHMMRSGIVPALSAMTGAAVLEWGGIDAPSWIDLVLLLTPFSFAMCLHRSEKFAAMYPQHTTTLTGTMLASVTFYALLWTFFQGNLPITIKAWQAIASILNEKRWLLLLIAYQGILATGWTAISEQQALKVLSASDMFLIYALEPIFATLFAYLFLHEQVSWSTLLGAVLIVSACILGGKY